MKKVLSIVWYKVFPPLFGGQKGITGFTTELADHIPVVCICSRDNEGALPDSNGLKILPWLPVGKTQFFNPWCWKKIREVARKENVSHIILEHPYHALAAYLAKKASGASLILHSHNIESERFRRLGRWWWPILKRYEKWIHRHASVSLFKTEEDRDFAIKHFRLAPEKCMVIPYGITRPVKNENAGDMIRQRHGIGTDERIFLFAGTLDYEPNAEAVKNIFREIIPRLEDTGIPYKIIICGRNQFSEFRYLRLLTHPSVINAGKVDDIANYFSAADVFLNPVQAGGGIQSKNIDALSYHCNTVCFAQMATGMPLHACGNKLLLVENGNWDNFIAMTVKALDIKDKTPDRFFDYFDWKNIISGLVDHLNKNQ